MLKRVITFDGKAIFGTSEHHLHVDSWRRDSVERRFGGLSGAVSLDLGRRSRQLRQTGMLVAGSVSALLEMFDSISNYIDGQDYILTDSYGQSFPHVRMDRFQPTGPVAQLTPARCEYEIVYTQLNP